MLEYSGRMIFQYSAGALRAQFNSKHAIKLLNRRVHQRYSSSPTANRTGRVRFLPVQVSSLVTASISVLLAAAFIGVATLTPACAEAPKSKISESKTPKHEKTNTKYSSTSPLSSSPQIEYNNNPSNIQEALIELTKLLSSSRVSAELGPRISHSSTEWSEAPHGDADRYALVVSPKTTKEVSEVAKICHRRRIPMVAFSGGTSLEGTLAATQGGVCVDFRLMNKVVEVRKDDLDATVQPAVGYEELNAMLEESELFFPPDPGPGAQVGGMM